ncbi:ribonuclease HII [Bacillus tianshenii]|uniref:ribonuclease HII n=1 Tax=Sutcliffiella tianshenii TaxID=1463404 RepID=UPI001CD6562B|nr:ribonuclease HII [Bacillus tianshenii]MCA1321382.1 ribonuclease HII [Bacillus tianshenii]
MKNTPIKEIEAKLREVKSADDPYLNMLKNDERKGVRALLNRWEKRIGQDMQLHTQFEEMSQFESALYQQGCHHIAGVDEVGRGPLAGPVIAAAVILPKDFLLLGLTDSKKLSASKRAYFNEYIKEHAISYAVGIVDSKTIDRINIYEATKLAMRLAIEKLSVKPDHLLIDAMKLDQDIPQTSIIKGDARSISIAASSVLAKEARDAYMKELGAHYPAYGFEKNMGYGTKEHLEAIKEVGIMKEHRHSFSPVKELVVS